MDALMVEVAQRHRVREVRGPLSRAWCPRPGWPARTIGLELFAGVDDAGADSALGSLRALTSLVPATEGSGPASA
jgi:hypothetical protein